MTYYTCVCPGGGVWRSIWYDSLCVVSCGVPDGGVLSGQSAAM